MTSINKEIPTSTVNLSKDDAILIAEKIVAIRKKVANFISSN